MSTATIIETTITNQTDELVDALTAAAQATMGAAGELRDGHRRRVVKLARQQHAAARLLARGAHLELPATLAKSVEFAARRTADVADLGSVDAEIRTWTVRIVALHTWRGHTASTPSVEV